MSPIIDDSSKPVLAENQITNGNLFRLLKSIEGQVEALRKENRELRAVTEAHETRLTNAVTAINNLGFQSADLFNDIAKQLGDIRGDVIVDKPRIITLGGNGGLH